MLSLFSTRRRLVALAVVASVLALGLGFAVNHYVRHIAGDVGVNLVLIVIWTAAMMGAAIGQTLLAADLLWGERWRRRTLLGWQPPPDEVVADDVKDRTWLLYAMFIVLIGANYALNSFANGNFFGWYRFRGFALVQLRSDDAEQRLEGVAELADQEDPAIALRISELLDDPSSEVRAAVLGVMGDRKVESVRPRIEAALKEPDEGVRGAAAEALGRIGGEGVRQALTELLVPATPMPVRRGAIAGLGVLGDRAAGPALVAQLADGALPDEARAVAAWALGELKPEGGIDRLAGAVDGRGESTTRCAALHALAKVLNGKAPDVPKPVKAAFLLGHGTEGYDCPRAFITPHTETQCFVKLNRPSEVPYEGDCIRWQMSSPERFRVKLVRAAARMAGKGSMRFLASVYNDTGEPPSVRNWAGELFLTLKGDR